MTGKEFSGVITLNVLFGRRYYFSKYKYPILQRKALRHLLMNNFPSQLVGPAPFPDQQVLSLIFLSSRMDLLITFKK